MSRPPGRPRWPGARRRLAAASLFFFSVVLSLAAAGCERSAPEMKLVAVVVDLTGPGRAAGQEIHDAARLALREAKRESRVGLELLVQDDRGDPERAVRLAGYLTELPEVVAVIGPSAPAAAGALAVYGGDGGVPTLVPISLEARLVKNGDRVFGLAPSAEYLGETLAWFLVTELSADSAAILVASDPFGQALERGFGGELGRLGGGTAARVTLGTGGGADSPLAPAAVRAPAAIVAARPDAAGAPIGTLRDAGFSGPILLAGRPALPPPAAADSSGGIYYPLYFDPARDPEARSFAARFQAVYGHAPGEAAALAYDGLNLVLEALDSGAADRPSVLRWLQGTGPSTSFQGVSGRFFFSREHFAVRDVAVASLGAGGPVATRAGDVKPSPAVAPR